MKKMLYYFLMIQYKAKTSVSTISLYDFVFTFEGGIYGETSKWTSTIKFTKSLGGNARPPQSWETTLTIYSDSDAQHEAVNSLLEFLKQSLIADIEVAEVYVESDEMLSEEIDDDDTLAPIIPLRMDLTDD